MMSVREQAAQARITAGSAGAVHKARDKLALRDSLTPSHSANRRIHGPGGVRAIGSAGDGQRRANTLPRRPARPARCSDTPRPLPVRLRRFLARRHCSDGADGCHVSPSSLPLVRTEIARPFRAKLRSSFATVQDTPVRRYGGLKDQDRIFTNAYCRHDHGIKGATVRLPPGLLCAPVLRMT